MTLITVELDAPDDLDGWKRSAAALDCAGVSEDRIRWRLRDEVDNDLFGGAVPVPSPVQRVQTIRADFGSLCDQLLLHQSGNRFALAYRLYRRLRNEPDLLKRLHDPDVSMAQQMIRDHTGHHRFADRHRADADAGVMTALGRNIGLVTGVVDRAPRRQNR